MCLFIEGLGLPELAPRFVARRVCGAALAALSAADLAGRLGIRRPAEQRRILHAVREAAATAAGRHCDGEERRMAALVHLDDLSLRQVPPARACVAARVGGPRRVPSRRDSEGRR